VEYEGAVWGCRRDLDPFPMLRRSAPTRREASEVVRWAALRVYAPCRDPASPSTDVAPCSNGPATPVTSRDGSSKRRSGAARDPLGAPGCGLGGRPFESRRGFIGSVARESAEQMRRRRGAAPCRAKRQRPRRVARLLLLVQSATTTARRLGGLRLDQESFAPD
jgi:hypothetical protein